MKQFATIFSFEFKSFLKNKTFVGITLFLVLAIAVVMFFPRVKEAFFDKEPENELSDTEQSVGENEVETDLDRTGLPVMLIKAEGEGSEALFQSFFAAFSGYDVKLSEDSLDDIKTQITEGEAECAFVLDGPLSYTYYVNNLSLYDSNEAIAESVLASLYEMKIMTDLGLSAEEAAAMLAVTPTGSIEALGVDQMDNYWYTYIMIFALYMVILLYGQMVASGVATEKSSRAMELLITSVKPVPMMFGKVLSACFAGLLQLVAIFGSAILFYSVNKSYWGDNPIIAAIFDMPVSLFVYMLVFFILGFLIYAFMFGAVGSTASKLEDINTAVMPVTLMFVVGFIIVMMSFSTDSVDTLLMKVCSFVPFTSSMAMFTRIAMSTVPWYEITASIGILAASVALVGAVSAKIYRMGVLLYGTPMKLPAIIKAAFKK
ncbi:MAG: ABC transporter permease [Clostridia bacterium]|nr:ABC transporter permease [Clostridia bacterium]